MKRLFSLFQSEAKFEEDKEQVQRKLMDDQNDLLNRYKSREVRCQRDGDKQITIFFQISVLYT